MPRHSPQIGDQVVIERDDIQGLFDALIRKEYRVVGPTVRDGAVVYDEVASASELPIGWSDKQEAGTYRLKKRSGSKALFGYVSSPHSWKKFLYPPVLRLLQAERDNGKIKYIPESEAAPKYALIGVRACELAAIAIQDKVLTQGAYIDATYLARRRDLFIVAVNCGQAGGTCFCASMGTGPKVTGAFDLALTEIVDSGHHYFVAEVGTSLGGKVLQDVPHREATAEDKEAAEKIVAETAQNMGRELDTTDLKDLLNRNTEILGGTTWHHAA